MRITGCARVFDLEQDLHGRRLAWMRGFFLPPDAYQSKRRYASYELYLHFRVRHRGHPDKVCDYIADSILDEHLTQDPKSRVACEVLCKHDTVVLAGEITSTGTVDYESIVRQAAREIGYNNDDEPFNANKLKVVQFLTAQASEIAQGVNGATTDSGEQGAGDQGI